MMHLNCFFNLKLTYYKMKTFKLRLQLTCIKFLFYGVILKFSILVLHKQNAIEMKYNREITSENICASVA